MRYFFTYKKCNEMMRRNFLTNISQGSVATRLRCGGIFNDCCIAIFWNATFIKYPTTPQTCRYTTLWNVYVRKFRLIISLHFFYVKKYCTEISRYVKVIFFCFNVQYSIFFIEYTSRWISHSLCTTFLKVRLHCNSERILKVGQYLTIMCRAFGVHFFWPTR